MINLSFKQKLIVAIIVIGLILVAIFQQGFDQIFPSSPPRSSSPAQPPSPPQSPSEEPKLLSTNPSPLNNATILPTQTIEFTFNQPIENRGELKYEIEPKTEVEVMLSADKKTAKITSKKPLILGQTYVIKIKTDTKFDSKKRLPDGLNFTFKTINYRGV